MKFLEFLLGTLSYTSGIISIGAFFLAWYKTREKAFLYYPFLLSTELLSLFYPEWGRTWAPGPDGLQPWMEFVSFEAYALYYFIGNLLAVAVGHSLTGRLLTGAKKWVIIALIPVPLLFLFFEALRFVFGILDTAAYHWEYSVCDSLILAFTFILVIHFWLVRNAIKVAFYRLWALCYCAVFLTYLLVRLSTWPIFNPTSVQQDEFNQLFFLIGSCVNIVIIARYLFLRGPSLQKVLPAFKTELLERLLITERESQIIDRLNRGSGTKEIAWELKISANTVKNHISSIYRKSNVQSRVELLNLFREI